MQSSLYQDLQQFERGQPQPLLARIAQQLSLADITTIQEFLSIRRQRQRPVRVRKYHHMKVQLHYQLFLQLNLQLAKQGLRNGAPYRPSLLRQYVIKYVAMHAFHRNQSLARKQIRFGQRYLAWPRVPDHEADLQAVSASV